MTEEIEFPKKTVADLVALIALIFAVWLCFTQIGLIWLLAGFPLIGSLWYAASRPRRLPGKAGQLECPACESLQTDREPSPLGPSADSMQCFSCGHVWRPAQT